MTKRISLLYFVSLYAFLLYRLVYLVPGIISNPTIYWNQGNSFDDSATVVSLANYKKYGFWSSMGLERREGMATHSLFAVPCDFFSQSKDFQYDLDRIERPMDSLSGSCIYTRTPHLHLWWNYVVYSIFNQSILAIKIVSLSFLFFSLIFFYRFLLPYVGVGASTAAIVFFSFSFSFWGWGQALYNQSYQLFFVSLYLYLFNRRFKTKMQFIALLSVSFLIASITNEYLTFLICYALGHLLFKDERQCGLKKLFATIGGIAASITSFFMLKAWYFHSFSRVLEDITSTLSSRYPVSLHGGEFFQATYTQLANIIDMTLIPLWMLLFMLVTIFGAHYRNKLKLREIFLLFFCGISVQVVFVDSSFYHPHLFYRHFIPFVLLSVALFFSSVSIVSDKIKKVYIGLTIKIASFVFVIYFAHMGLLKQAYIDQSADKIDRKKIASFRDYTFQVYFAPLWESRIFNFDKWFHFMQKNRLVDGALYNPFLTKDQQTLKIKKGFGHALNWYFGEDHFWNSFVLYTDSGEGLLAQNDCQFYVSLQSSRHLVIPSSVLIEKKGPLDRVLFQFAGELANVITLNCRPKEDLSLYEIIWFYNSPK